MSTFSQAEFEAVVPAIFENDADAISAWIDLHLTDPQAFAQLLHTLARLIAAIWPLELTRGADITGTDFWAMEAIPGGDPTRDNWIAAQIITASLNEDWDTVNALILAVMDDPNEVVLARVTVHLLKAFGDGLRAIAAAREG